MLEDENLNRISDKKIKRAYRHELFATLKRSKTKIAWFPSSLNRTRRGSGGKEREGSEEEDHRVSTDKHIKLRDSI